MQSRINALALDDMGQIPDLANLPRTLVTLMRPWVSAVESTGQGKGALITGAAVSAAAALRRYVLMTPAIDEALISARTASDALARGLGRSMPIADEREVALTALAALVEQLRRSQPSEMTRVLKLGW